MEVNAIYHSAHQLWLISALAGTPNTQILLAEDAHCARNSQPPPRHPTESRSKDLIARWEEGKRRRGGGERLRDSER